MKHLFLLILLIIFNQDIKERQVTFVVLLLGIILGGHLHYTNSFFEFFLFNISINVLLISLISIMLYLYVKLKLQQPFFEAIGVGDILFFLLLAVSFPTISFLVVFSVSLLFSLILFLTVKRKLKKQTVPLAGFQALFLFLILFINLVFDIVPIYAY